MNNLLRCLVEKSMRKKNEYGIDLYDNSIGVIKDIEVGKYDLSVFVVVGKGNIRTYRDKQYIIRQYPRAIVDEFPVWQLIRMEMRTKRLNYSKLELFIDYGE